MSVRTYVSTTVVNDRLDDVLNALEDLDPQAIVGAAHRSDDPDVPPGVSVSLAGDVREAVQEQLKAFPDVECEVEVRDTEGR
ncbi:nuclear transport factor 2 family protein [Streptomyces sp. NPDC000983]|uniref:hypothetical protein n=1 Tax=Streptomyces sp. NPDC000983 TaxID=3154373 RepID=UPI00331FABDA